jgi:antitoxin component of MazEF toxin-antitoxin module
MDEDETTLAAPRKVRREGDRVVVSLPEEAVEGSGLTVGEETMVGYKEDGSVVLVPWGREDVKDLYRGDDDPARRK